MSITAHEYTPHHRPEWEEFLRRCNNATMFHKQDFLDYHPDGRFDFSHIMFREGDKLIAVLPGGFFKGQETEYWSPVGASYGGFTAEDLSFEKCLEIVDCFIEYARRKGCKEAFIIPPPFFYSTGT